MFLWALPSTFHWAGDKIIVLLLLLLGGGGDFQFGDPEVG